MELRVSGQLGERIGGLLRARNRGDYSATTQRSVFWRPVEELLYGRTREDRALGRSGIVTAVASPKETADALAELARDPELHSSMVRAGIARVETYYREEDLNQTYLDLYDSLGAREDFVTSGGGR